ncbi:major capsid protein [Xylella taiwanensis]|uniref:major capsid protein n=1 Tax=Xylella taiwanensis TaxID=1444770 RepID=UPI002ED34A11
MLRRPGVVGGLLAYGFVAPAFAAGIDVSEVLESIKAGLVPIAAIGAAVLSIHVAIKIYKWIRQSL